MGTRGLSFLVGAKTGAGRVSIMKNVESSSDVALHNVDMVGIDLQRINQTSTNSSNRASIKHLFKFHEIVPLKKRG